MDEMAKGCTRNHELHDEHEFSLIDRESVYCCNACLETGIGCGILSVSSVILVSIQSVL
ncbi:LOW QUALITY PROTEIN: hypothetical protein TorRG33x02_011580 [Trema orientale]|uniref:Uncharacterized protein n=1 Tax=Trema orientale TaxID=63057 RepID=A0A2P5FZ95_TREOI|nr:LOW QUALITY PROTEIN: hypothetical protein TorRG33x02_011580 [Trema orientale]